jgi:hypothetical protein
MNELEGAVSKLKLTQHRDQTAYFLNYLSTQIKQFWISGSPDNGPDKDSIENKIPFILYVSPMIDWLFVVLRMYVYVRLIGCLLFYACMYTLD